MKLVFIRPPARGLLDRSGSRYNRAWPPLDLLNCSAIARRAGHDAKVLDLAAEYRPMEEVRHAVAQSEYACITTAALDRWQCPVPDLTDEFCFIRSLGADNIYILGTHGALYPEWILEETAARGVFRLEPELFITALCGGTPVTEIPGVSHHGIGGVIHNPHTGPVNLETLPLPDYDTIDLKHYAYTLLGSRTALLETTRGCSFSCSFCLKKMYGNGVREKAPEQVTEEIIDVVTRHKAGSLYFIDLEFTLKRDMTLHVCRVLQELGGKIPWCCQTRVDLVDPILLREMAAAGCTLIHYGVESGNQRILDSIRKKTDLATIETAIKATRNTGIATACFFLFGFPGETEQDMADTLAFAKSLNPDFASFHMAAPYPETRLSPFADSNDRFPVCCKTGLSREKLEQLVRRAYLSYYVRPKYLIGAFLRNRPSLWLQQFRLFKEFLTR